MNLFDIPKELTLRILGFLSSKNRAEFCSVSKESEHYAINTSGIKYGHEELYTKYNSEDISQLMKKYPIQDIIVSGDYHLLVRLKWEPKYESQLVDIEFAGRSGCMDIVGLSMKNEEKISLNYEYGLYGACRSGNKAIVELMLTRGAKSYEGGLFDACIGGHQAIVEMMLSLGANNVNVGLNVSCQYGHLATSKCLISCGANAINLAFVGACMGNHQAVIDYLITKGANDWAQGILATSDYDIFKFLVAKDAHASDTALKLACKKGFIDTVKFFNQSSYDLSVGLSYTCEYNVMDVFKYIVEELAKKDIAPVCDYCGYYIEEHDF